MAQGSDKTEGGQSRTSADFSRATDALNDMSAVPPVHPFLAQPTAAMVAATAMGLGFATQMAGVFLSAMQVAMEAGSQSARAAQARHEDAVDAPAEPTDDAGAEPVVATKTPAKSERPVVKTPARTAKTKRKPAAPVAVLSEAKVEPKMAREPAAKPVAAEPKKASAKARASKTVVSKTEAAKPASDKASSAKAKTPRAKRAWGKVTDDLKRISGLGPKAEQMLQRIGVTSLAAIAAWSQDDIARIDGELGLDGRIARDDWVGQAKRLTEKTSPKGRA